MSPPFRINLTGGDSLPDRSTGQPDPASLLTEGQISCTSRASAVPKVQPT